MTRGSARFRAAGATGGSGAGRAGAVASGATSAAGAGSETQLPCSHTRSPLQSVSLVHCACDDPATNPHAAAPKSATNNLDDIQPTLLPPVTFVQRITSLYALRVVLAPGVGGPQPLNRRALVPWTFAR